MGLFQIYSIGNSTIRYTVYAVEKEGMSALFLVNSGFEWYWVDARDFLPVK